ncbi:MAG: hypothetical protein ACREV4_14755 [Gammaproteobacteria bacterium]
MKTLVDSLVTKQRAHIRALQRLMENFRNHPSTNPALKREESEDALDKVLQDTSSASDPLAIIQPGHKAPTV